MTELPPSRRSLFRGRTCRSVAAGAIAAAVLTASAALPATADDQTVNLQGQPALTGLAADRNSSLFWVVTKTDASELTAYDAQGAAAGTMSFSDEVTDVQALSWRSGVLYIGDIGDPEGTRAAITVVRVVSPRVGQRQSQSFTFTYPDGAQDAAALMVSPRGNFYLVTRGKNPGIYRPSYRPAAGDSAPLQRVGDAPADVSDATFTADGQSMALRSPLGVTLINAFTYETVSRGPIEGWPPGESITTGLQGSPLMVGVAGQKSHLLPMVLPPGISSETPPAPTPTPTPTPSPKPSQSASSAVPSSVSTKAPSVWSSQTSGTVLSLGIALLVAVLAGAVTLIGRRH